MTSLESAPVENKDRPEREHEAHWLSPHNLYLVTVWCLLLGIFSQIGLAFFGVPLSIHRLVGLVIGVLAVLLALFAFRERSANRALAILLLVLLVLQPILIGFRGQLPVLAASHAMNAFAILGVALVLALDSDEYEDNG